MNDKINHPKHYASHPSGIECIEITEHMNFNKGNAIKYIWRAGDKGDEIEDLKKAAWYINREIERIDKTKKGLYATAEERALARERIFGGQYPVPEGQELYCAPGNLLDQLDRE